MSTIYDRISPIYDWLTLSERPFREEAARLLAVQEGETVLEIGCGTARGLLDLVSVAGSGPRGIGLDRSPGMIGQAQSNILKESEADVSLLLGDGLHLPLKNGCCDAVLLSFTLELFDLPQQHGLLSEIRRVLTENGRLAVVTLSTHRQTTAGDIYWALHERFPKVIDCRPITAVPLLSAAGFSLIEQQHHSMFGLPVSLLLANVIAK